MPVPEGIERPLWSVMIPIYNGARYLPLTIESLLVQAPGPEKMQIEVVDDASTDADIKELVERAGKGRISYFRQEENVGSLKNFETCLQRSRGQLIHLLHCDDIVKMGYYEKMESLFNQYPHIGAAFCSFNYIDEKGKYLWGHELEAKQDGILRNWLSRITRKQRAQYCTMSVKREVYETLGGFYGVTYGEDWEMWARLATRYEVAYTPEILAEYRVHTTSISSRSFVTAKNIFDIRWVIDRIVDFLPESEKVQAKHDAYQHYAQYALKVANGIWHQTYSKEATRLQIQEALRMYSGPSMYLPVLKLYTKMLINWEGPHPKKKN